MRNIGGTGVNDVNPQDSSCAFNSNVIGTQLLFSLPDSTPQTSGDGAITVLGSGLQYIPVYVQETLPSDVVGSYVINDSQQLPILNNTRQIFLAGNQIVTLNQVNETQLEGNELSPTFLSFGESNQENGDSNEPDDQKKRTLEDLTVNESGIPNDDIVEPPDNTCPEACDTCGLRFESRKLFKKHVLSHLYEKPLKCPHCPESFNHEYNYIPHLATHNEDNPYCPVCNKRFSRIAGLKAHIMIHQCDDTIPCPECLEEFSTQKLLEAHRLEHQSGFVKPPVRLHCCSHCGEQFPTRTFLKDHIKIVHKLKIPKKIKRGKCGYVCEFCKKRFQKPSQLIRHRRTHTGEKPFKCAECGKGFGQKGSLQIHMLKHSGLKPFSCQFCSSQFSQKGNLQAHIIRMHAEEKDEMRKLNCWHCSCVFRNLAGLTSHMARHHGVHQTTVKGKTITYELSYEDNTIIAGVTVDNDSSNKENEGKSKTRLDHAENTDGASSECNRESEPENKIPPSTDVINKCKHCGKVFRKRVDLVKHLKFHTDDKKHKCECGLQFSTKSLLLSHIKSAHPEALTFVCSICFSKFVNQDDLDVHRTSRHKQCLERAKRQGKLNSMLGKTSLEAMTESTDVQQTTESVTVPVSSSGHILGDIPLECAKLLITADGTIEVIHDKELESPSIANLPEITEPRVIELQPSEELIQEVIEEPTRENADQSRIHKCDHCNLAFKQKSHWKLHLRIHTGERPFSCVICDKAFASKSALTIHLGTHDEVPAFKCDDCGRAFSTARSLKRHMDLHVPGFTYSCSVCSRAYKTKVAWQKHLTTHMKASQVEATAQKKILEVKPIPTESHENERLINSADLQPVIVEVDQGKKDGTPGDSTSFQGDWNDLIQSLQPGQQFSFNGTQTYTSVGDSIPVTKTSNITSQQNVSTDGRICEFDEKNPIFNPLTEQSFDGCVFLQNGGHLQTNSQPLPTTVPSLVLPSQAQVNTHRCSLCNVSFDNLMELSIHKTTHLQDKWTVCAACGKLFSSCKEYKAHMKDCSSSQTTLDPEKHSPDFEFIDILPSKLQKCVKCDIHFLNAEDYVYHVNSNHGEFACKHCSKWFKHLEDIQAHQHSHKQDNEGFITSGDTQSGAKELPANKSSESPGDPLTLKPGPGVPVVVQSNEHENDRSVASKDQLDQKKKGRNLRRTWRRPTIRMLTEEEQIAVTKWSPRSISERILQQSILHEKKAQDSNSSSATESKETSETKPEHRNQCNYCPKSFRKPSDLVRHLRVHTGERPYTCTSCNKSFSIKSTANSHINIHKKERMYSCHICHKLFAAVGSLKVHMRLHTGAKPFSCDLCPAKFRTSGHRKAHMYSHFRKEVSSKVVTTAESGISSPRPLPPAKKTSALTSTSVDFLTKPAEKKQDYVEKEMSDLESLKKSLTNNQFLFALDGSLDCGERLETSSFNPQLNNPQFFLKEVKSDDQAGAAAHFVVTIGDDMNYQENINDLLESVPNLSEDHEERFKLDLDLEVPKEQMDEGVCETCSVCGKVYSSCLELDSHMKKEHFTNSLLSCSVCKQNFRGKTDLEVHMLVHELDQLSCHACSLEFPDEIALKKHKCTNDDSEIKSMPSTSLDLATVVHEFFSFPAL